MGCTCSSDIDIKTIDPSINKNVNPLEKLFHPMEDEQECMTCENTFEKDKLYLFCNKEPCTGFMCETCIKKYIEDIKNGYIISTMKLKCPYCMVLNKLILDSRTRESMIHEHSNTDISYHLRQHCYLYDKLSSFYTSHKDASEIAICKCGKIDIPQKGRCSSESDDPIPYMCEQCYFKLGIQNQQCKKCKHAIEKINGCNHVVCLCEYEWCWVCKNKWGTMQCTTSVCNPNPHNDHYHEILLRNMGYRACPKCGVFTERLDGNNVMPCTCGTTWCWHCNREKSSCSCCRN